MIRNAVHRIAGRALPMLCVAGILLLSLGVEASGSPQPETRKVGGREEETDTSPPFRWAQRKDRILLTIDLQVYNLPIPSLQKKKLSLSLSLSLFDKFYTHTHTHILTAGANTTPGRICRSCVGRKLFIGSRSTAVS
jgi:hypothetical protein